MPQVLIEVDLRQAESRFVAWDGPVPKLMEMYQDGVDIHKFVASHPLLFNKPQDQITTDERQLGKKTGHAANYDVGPATLAASCLKEMNLVLPVAKAEKMLLGYHSLFGGAIRSWQAQIAEEVRQTKKLETPLGRVRYFYDRLGPDLNREAYAYRPQATIPDIINRLIKHLFGFSSVILLNQVHDSVWLECADCNELEVYERIKDQNAWNPILKLRGGDLRIPIEIARGTNFKQKEVVFEG